MRHILFSLLAALLFMVSGIAQVRVPVSQKPAQAKLSGAPLLSSNFRGTAPGVNTPWLPSHWLAPNMLYSGWDLGAGTTGAPAVDDALGFTVTGGATEATLAEAITAASYVSFSLQPTAGGTLDLSGVRMRIGVQRLDWHAPRRYALLSSISGFAAGSELFASPYLESWNQSSQVWDSFLPATGFAGIQGPVEFRLYCFGGQFVNKRTSVNEFTMVGGLPTVQFGLTSGAGGVATVSPVSPLYQEGQQVQLNATPDAGFRFAGWSGDIAGFGNPRSLVLNSSMQVQADFEAVPLPAMSVGANLAGVTDSNSNWVFSDLFRRTRTWMTRAEDGSGSWDSGFAGEIPLDAQGYPHSIPFMPAAGGSPQAVHTIMVRANEAGPHRILFEGVGAFNCYIGGTLVTQVVANGPASEVQILFPGAATIGLTIVSSAATPNNLRNIRIVADANLATYQNEPFHPQFKATLAEFEHLRFMDWGLTNGSFVREWADRTSPSNFTQSAPSGVSLEVQIDLANRLIKDAWFCVPHEASDDYVLQMARLIRDTLDPTLLAYVEYSNETWNTHGSFTQTIYVQQMGLAQGLSTNSWDAGQYFAAKRSAEIWQIFDTEFGGAARQRTRRVLATHAASVSTTQLRITALNSLSMNPFNQHADALAIAPYFGSNFAPSAIPPTPGTQYPTVNDLVTIDAPARVAEAISMAAAQKSIANMQGMELICYEGGQHYVTIYGAENDPVMVQVLHDVNRDPRIYDLYITYLDGLKAAGVSAFANFSHCGVWSKWGAWGVLESIDQPASAAHKYRALVDWILAQ